MSQLPPFYDRVKYQAESQEYFDLEEAMIVMRNMHANRIERNDRPRAQRRDAPPRWRRTLLRDGGINFKILYLLQEKWTRRIQLLQERK